MYGIYYYSFEYRQKKGYKKLYFGTEGKYKFEGE
jgi:hypothetical protein